MPPAVLPPPDAPTSSAPLDDDAPESRAEAVVRRILQADDVPAFSRAMREIMASAGRDEASAQHLANLVLRDYALTTKVIRAANSAHYNRTGRAVQSATHALMLLGARTVRELAGSLMLFEHYRRRSPGLKELMLLSLLTASHARAAAELTGGTDPETAHLCGMFRSLGEVLVAAHLPEDYAAVLRRVADRAADPRRERLDAAALRATCAIAVLGCPFEDVGVAIARHWGMPDAVRHGMRAAGAPGEDRASALTAFAHALTGAVYREDTAKTSAEAGDAVVGTHGVRVGLNRAQCRTVAERAVADTRELFAAAGVRLDDLRLARQVAGALADAPAKPHSVSRADRTAGAPSTASTDASPECAPEPAITALATTPPIGAPALDAPAATLGEVRAQLAPELAEASNDPTGYDLARVMLIALEAVLRGGPFDRAAFLAADAPAGEFRPRTALGDGTDRLLTGPGVPFGAAAGPSGSALLRGSEVHLAHGTRLTLAESRLLRDWDAVSVVLLPIRVGDAVIGCLHADRRTAFAAPDAATMAYVRQVAYALEHAIAVRRAPAAVPLTPTFDATAKVAAVLRVLRGEEPETVARALGTDAETLARWRADFMSGAAARLGATT